MNRIELAKAAFNMDNPDRSKYYSDDFQWIGAEGSPTMDKTAWLAMNEPMKSAFPDLALVIEKIREDNGDVVVTSRFQGTFRNDLDLSPIGMGVIPATGKAVDFPAQRDRLSFVNGKVSRIQNLETGQDAGMGGFLKSLGVNPG